MSQSRSHLILVPGFAGFDMLGSVIYFSGVTEVLRSADSGPYRGPLSVHCFPNLPTASVDTRARALLRWLADRFRQGVFYENVGAGHRDFLHLVGHSTGGRDIKTLMLLLLAGSEQRQSFYGVPAETLLQSIGSIQFLSTPHRGTNLAHYFLRRKPLVMLAAMALHEALWWARARNASAAARSARTLLRMLGYSDGLIRAVLDTIDRFHTVEMSGLARSEARAEYFNVLRWLLHVAEDTSVFQDLDPLGSSGYARHVARGADRRSVASGAHSWIRELVASIESAKQVGRTCSLGAEVEEDLAEYYKQRNIALRSIVTRAKRDPGGPFLGVFSIFHGITSDIKDPKVMEALGPPCSVPRLDNPAKLEELRASMNDGIVNCVSMVYPDEARSFLVEADHADIMGHYRYISAEAGDGADPNYGGYDLFQSRSTFDRSRFEMVWKSIGKFAVDSENRTGGLSGERHIPVVPPGASAGIPAVSHFPPGPFDSEGDWPAKKDGSTPPA